MLSLYIPKLEDYWYEEKLQSDSKTMSYNAGYDVSYYGYHYDTGCIDFPKEKWKETFDKRINENKFFAYIKVFNVLLCVLSISVEARAVLFHSLPTSLYLLGYK